MTKRRLDFLMVAGEPCWPVVNGGRARTSGLATALAREFDLAVAAPPDASELDSEGVDMPVQSFELPSRKAPSVRDSLGVRPRLGRTLLGQDGCAALLDVIARTRPRVLLYAMSYLAAVLPRITHSSVIVDFANLETRRQRSLATDGSLRSRLSVSAEAAKAWWWEPRVARSSTFVLAVHEADARRLTQWGARSLFVPNASQRPNVYGPSANTAPVVFVASGSYRPNVEAGRWLIEQVWPRVRKRVPSAELRIVGHRSKATFGWAAGQPGVEVLGTVLDLGQILASSSLVVSPVACGGGTQLKVIESLAAGRAVVLTTYGARSIPHGFGGACVVADGEVSFAEAISRLLIDSDERHRREEVAWSAPLRTWDDVAQPIFSAVRPLIEKTRDRALEPA
jgi:glycosyltransferase involved in cell wall biosynthesis